MSAEIAIRAVRLEDAPHLVPLLGELGYEVGAEVIAGKLSSLMGSCADRVLIAARAQEPIGCIACHVLEPLHTRGRLGRITALVIAAGHQRLGVGVSAAEEFFRAQGCARVEVTSAERRSGAHAFYLAAGFADGGRRFIKWLRANLCSGSQPRR